MLQLLKQEDEQEYTLEQQNIIYQVNCKFATSQTRLKATSTKKKSVFLLTSQKGKVLLSYAVLNFHNPSPITS
jgi:hypothetical protein